MSQRVTVPNPEENAASEICAAPGAAVAPDEDVIDADLQAVIDAWPDLPNAIKAGEVDPKNWTSR